MILEAALILASTASFLAGSAPSACLNIAGMGLDVKVKDSSKTRALNSREKETRWASESLC